MAVSIRGLAGGRDVQAGGPRVLVVEDEFLIAGALQVMLENRGARGVGPVPGVSAALEIITAGEHLDCALLDVRVADQAVFPVAEALLARGVRFAFITGYDRWALPTAYQDATIFSKVQEPEAFLRWVMGS